ncbi:hypothetical protein IFM89_011389 [Coptis chinensis]|uniref:Myb/SANT-like DNA-binding domain-containing protein n=1 Tax=Coptis chinensis TaxID=261450 RepID=A0A835LUJ7_9MAGN|nr:hypothetical protein IFM89_011389 [Coptis chinensis]
MHVHHQQHPHALHQQQQHLHSQQGSMVHPPMHDVFPLTVGRMHECEQTMTIVEYNKGEREKTTTSDEDEPSFTEGGVDGHGEPVSYMGEDAAVKCSNGRRKYAIMQKKGKWKSISKVMAERGYCVSPQQCEDKFNDINKRYKRLTYILRRGTSCKVVENPTLLDMMDHLSEKAKETVRKRCAHTTMETDCISFLIHHCKSLQLALRSRENDEILDTRKNQQDDVGGGDRRPTVTTMMTSPRRIMIMGPCLGFKGGFAKRMK